MGLIQTFKKILSSRIILRNIVILIGLSVMLYILSSQLVSASLTAVSGCSVTVLGGSATCTGEGTCAVGDVRAGHIQITTTSSGSCPNIYTKNKVQITGSIGGPGLHSTAQTLAGPAEVQVLHFFTVDWNCDGSNNSGDVTVSTCSQVSCSASGNPPACDSYHWDTYYCQYVCTFDYASCENSGWYWNFETNTCHDYCTPGVCAYPKEWNEELCRCIIDSPILIDVSDDGFNLTNEAGGVNFNLNVSGTAEHLSWTSIDSDDAWLVLDRNGNGTIDDGRELFGSFTPQPEPVDGVDRNGFLALAEYDKPENGGNGDGKITQNDTIFSSLRLWQDTNHNGLSETTELHTMHELGLKTLELDYKQKNRTDRYGNLFMFRAEVRDTQDAQLGRWAWDVVLIKAP